MIYYDICLTEYNNNNIKLILINMKNENYIYKMYILNLNSNIF